MTVAGVLIGLKTIDLDTSDALKCTSKTKMCVFKLYALEILDRFSGGKEEICKRALA